MGCSKYDRYLTLTVLSGKIALAWYVFIIDSRSLIKRKQENSTACGNSSKILSEFD